MREKKFLTNTQSIDNERVVVLLIISELRAYFEFWFTKLQKNSHHFGSSVEKVIKNGR